MPAPLLYLDTSVLGGFYDDEFIDDTRALWGLRERGVVRFRTSRVTLNELAGAPLLVRELAARTFADERDLIEVSQAAHALAQAYLAAGVVSPRFPDDALHVAVATCEGIDCVVSWNFKHLASRSRNCQFNAVNQLRGWPLIRIVSPTQLLGAQQIDQV
jgi:predicted nucleic acid-binding protein